MTLYQQSTLASKSGFESGGVRLYLFTIIVGVHGMVLPGDTAVPTESCNFGTGSQLIKRVHMEAYFTRLYITYSEHARLLSLTPCPRMKSHTPCIHATNPLRYATTALALPPR